MRVDRTEVKKACDAIYPPTLTNKTLLRRTVISSLSAGGKGSEEEEGESKTRQATERRLGRRKGFEVLNMYKCGASIHARSSRATRTSSHLMYKDKGPSSPLASPPSLSDQFAIMEKRCRRARMQERYLCTLPAQKEEGATGETAALPPAVMPEERDETDATVTRVKAVGRPVAATPSPMPIPSVSSGGVSTRGLSLRRKRKAAVSTTRRQRASCGDCQWVKIR